MKKCVSALALASLAVASTAFAAAVLEKVSPPAQKMAVWGFKNPVNATEVKAAVAKLSGEMTGEGHRIIVMTGTHGVCKPAGLVGSQEIKFAEEDVTNLKKVKTKDGKPVAVQIWPVNTVEGRASEDDRLKLTAFLNQSLRAIGEQVAKDKAEDKTLVLLAYCCSAGQ